MKKKTLLALALVGILSLFTACGNLGSQKSESGLTKEELQTQIDKKFEEIDGVIKGHEDLWQKLSEAGKDMKPDQGDTTLYSGYMAKLIKEHGDFLSETEKKDLGGDIEKIKTIEKDLEKFETELAKLNEATGETSEANLPEAFPAFEGKDLEGNPVDNSLFTKNKVTVVNFWFSGCSPCVEELNLLNDLNNKLKEKGGAVVGINTDTLDGPEAQVKEAKEILSKKGATYTNIYFAKDSEAGKFSDLIIGFPTTIVLDNQGKLVGEPLMGAIDYPDVEKALQAQIDKALGGAEGQK